MQGRAIHLQPGFLARLEGRAASESLGAGGIALLDEARDDLEDREVHARVGVDEGLVAAQVDRRARRLAQEHPRPAVHELVEHAHHGVAPRALEDVAGVRLGGRSVAVPVPKDEAPKLEEADVAAALRGAILDHLDVAQCALRGTHGADVRAPGAAEQRDLGGNASSAPRTALRGWIRGPGRSLRLSGGPLAERAGGSPAGFPFASKGSDW